MGPIKIGINGMGRIGRTILREIYNRGANLKVVAVNNPGAAKRFVHLVKYDSIHGTFQKSVKFEENQLQIEDDTISFYGEMDPTQIPWNKHEVDIVIDATGFFKDKEGLSKHLGRTVKKVIMCAPGKKLDGTFVMGINTETYDPANHHVISNASCTTNCLAPLAKVLHENFGIESGLMTTVHSYTSDQQLLDGNHSDPRRARAAALSMVPTTTGAAIAVGHVIPELNGKLDGYAVRVPTPNVSLVDLTVNLSKNATKEEINQALKEASETKLKGILKYEEEELVSVDYMSMRESSCVDASLTTSMGKFAKIISWYDNECGFSNRVIDLATFIGEKL